MCRQWLHDRKCNSWPRSAQGADVFGDQFIEVERAPETASARRPRSRDRATAGDHIALLGFGRRRRVEVRAEGRVKAETASIGAAVTVTQKSRRRSLRRQPAVLIERSPTQPACDVPHRGVCVDGLLSTNGVRGVAEAASCGVGDGPSRRTSGAAQWVLCWEPWRSRRSFSRRSFFPAAHTRRN